MPQTITFKAKGVTFDGRQSTIKWLEKNSEGSFCKLRREITNQYDPNAIQIIAHAAKKYAQIGYVPKELAETFAPMMDSGKQIWCKDYRIISCPDHDTKGVELIITY